MALEMECAALEAVLFAAGEPMEADRLAEALGCTADEVHERAAALSAHLDESGSGLQILQLGESYQLTTREQHAEVIRAALEVKRNTPLSNAAMETLTIIAYNQPVTKGFVERVRGVDSSSVVNTLVERGLLEEAGRIEVPGRPVTYRTTAQFLRCFGLQSLEELPPLPESAEPQPFDGIDDTDDGDDDSFGDDAEQPGTAVYEDPVTPEEEAPPTE